MFEYFYNEILRRTIISFGTLFNAITIKQTNASDDIVNTIRVPLAYGPTQKFLARLEQSPDLNKSIAMSLPRMSFEFTGLTYDAARKVTTTQQYTVKDPDSGEESKKIFMPVPYNMQFELSIMSKLNDDALQIVEQILPFFQPEYSVTLKERPELGIVRDVPIILNDISYEDDYEGEFLSRRAIIYTLNFTVKFFLYGPVQSQKVIKSVQVDQYSDMPSVAVSREQRYSATPKPSTATYDDTDDFGFNETVSFFEDSKKYNPVTGNDE